MQVAKNIDRVVTKVCAWRINLKTKLGMQSIMGDLCKHHMGIGVGCVRQVLGVCKILGDMHVCIKWFHGGVVGCGIKCKNEGIPTICKKVIRI
jgi:hypothetical protein